MLTTNFLTLFVLFISFLTTAVLSIVILKKIAKSQLRTWFLLTIACLLICDIGLIGQILFSEKLGIPPIYFDYFVYIGTCFLPVCLLFTSIVFSKTKIKFKKSYLLLFVVPILSLLILWTNDYHHLFYIKYSINLNETQYGPYLFIHSVYSYLLLLIALIRLIKYSIKNAGFFSKQSLLIILGTLIPLVVNIISYLGIINSNVYVTPITFTIAVFFFVIAILKFKFLSIAPIALQRVVDRISDGYLVLNEDNKIIDFNKTLLSLFKLKDINLRDKNIFDIVKTAHIGDVDEKKLDRLLSTTKNTIKTQSLTTHFDKLNKYFNIEFSSLNNNKTFLGTLILFKDITQHIEDMQTIKDNQDSLMESERLASLGQLIGGIAHNLKTPIMSISGAAEGLTDLVKEYDMSIENPSVNFEDHHAIAKDMSVWIEKIKDYTEYMSDIITAVKGQAVTLSETENTSFDLEELVKRIDILMKHELKNAIIYLNVHMFIDSKIVIHGDVNSLVQVINNMISNAIQAYNGKTEEEINLDFNMDDNNNLIISIEDHADGLPQKVKDKLFKEMITTKGKNGTGLGLYMSYSTIKAHFNGNITFESEEGKGTKFNIILPL